MNEGEVERVVEEMVRIEKEFERRMVSQTTISFVFHSSLSFLPFSYLSSDDLRTDPRFCF